MLRYDRDKSRSSSPKRKEYSREEKRNGKKKDRRWETQLSKEDELRTRLTWSNLRSRSSSPREKRKDRRRWGKLSQDLSFYIFVPILIIWILSFNPMLTLHCLLSTAAASPLRKREDGGAAAQAGENGEGFLHLNRCFRSPILFRDERRRSRSDERRRRSASGDRRRRSVSGERRGRR